MHVNHENIKYSFHRQMMSFEMYWIWMSPLNDSTIKNYLCRHPLRFLKYKGTPCNLKSGSLNPLHSRKPFLCAYTYHHHPSLLSAGLMETTSNETCLLRYFSYLISNVWSFPLLRDDTIKKVERSLGRQEQSRRTWEINLNFVVGQQHPSL